MKRPPYTTRSGLKIGIGYEPPRYVEESGDMLRLQSALIGRGKSFGGVIREWRIYIAFVAVLIACLLVANCKG